jgi:hypothetical protein
MTAGSGLDSSNAVELLSGVAQQSFNPTAMSRLEGRPVVRFPEQLRLHRALERIGWTGVIEEFKAAARRRTRPFLGQFLSRRTVRFSLALGAGG